MSCIYVLKNIVNDKMYVGQTLSQFKYRLNRHIKEESVVGMALKKYGRKNFEHHLFYVPKDLLDYFEIEMIKRLNTISPNGYNLASGGNKNKVMSKEAREKMRDAKLGKKTKPHSEEWNENIRKGNLGVKRSKETRKSISVGKTGTKLGANHKKNIGTAGKKYYSKEGSREKLSLIMKKWWIDRKKRLNENKVEGELL